MFRVIAAVDVVGVVTGSFFAIVGVLMVWKGKALARLMVRWNKWWASRWPWLYPGPFRRWYMSETAQRVGFVLLGVVFASFGLVTAVQGLQRP
jgi:hypothetical protein